MDFVLANSFCTVQSLIYRFFIDWLWRFYSKFDLSLSQKLVRRRISKSSTCRELVAINFALEAFDNHLAGQVVSCNTDNHNVVRIIQACSMVKELQDTALNIFLVTSQCQIRLNISWLPRDQNSQANFLSKIVDFDDYSLHKEVFFHLENLLLAVIMQNYLSLILDSSKMVSELLTPSQGTGHLRIIGWCHQYLSLAGY